MNEARPTLNGANPPMGRLAPHPPPLRPAATQPGRPGIMPPPMNAPAEKDLEPVSLIEEHHIPNDRGGAHPPPPPAKKISFGAESLGPKKHEWKRVPFKNGQGAIRVKSFHGKYSEQGLEYLDNAINEWLDANPDVEVKFVTPTVLQFEGKIRENALVLNVWY
ncbi:MAG TPA: hypothetical protein VHD56_15950 [Tepidisphaeraceae bacterium]|nr:hypothetical protein [Tepidisphaeraceae bacterium]